MDETFHPVSAAGNADVWAQFQNYWAGTGPNSYWHNNDYMNLSFSRSQTYATIINYIESTGYHGKGKNGSYENGGISSIKAFSFFLLGFGPDGDNMSANCMGAMNWRAVRHGDTLNIVAWTEWSQNSFWAHFPWVKNVKRIPGQPNAPQSNVTHYFMYSIPIPKKYR